MCDCVIGPVSMAPSECDTSGKSTPVEDALGSDENECLAAPAQSLSEQEIARDKIKDVGEGDEEPAAAQCQATASTPTWTPSGALPSARRSEILAICQKQRVTQLLRDSFAAQVIRSRALQAVVGAVAPNSSDSNHVISQRSHAKKYPLTDTQKKN